jgi:hypothetical protein
MKSENVMAYNDPLRRAAASPPPPTGTTSQPSDGSTSDPLLIECDRCSLRGTGCGDCVVTFLLGSPPSGVALDDDERRAIDVLADAGLVPPLRMVEPLDSPATAEYP